MTKSVSNNKITSERAEVNLSGIKLYDGTWSLTATIIDYYNFSEPKLPTSFGNIANDVGFLLEHTGMLYAYSWDVTFNFTYEEE